MLVHNTLCFTQQRPTSAEPADISSWPAVELHLECFRIVLPTLDYSNTLLLNLGALHITSAVDFAGPDIRFIVSNSAFRRLSLLSSERKQPSLPAYQLNAYSISVWGLKTSNIFMK